MPQPLAGIGPLLQRNLVADLGVVPSAEILISFVCLSAKISAACIETPANTAKKLCFRPGFFEANAHDPTRGTPLPRSSRLPCESHISDFCLVGALQIFTSPTLTKGPLRGVGTCEATGECGVTSRRAILPNRALSPSGCVACSDRPMPTLFAAKNESRRNTLASVGPLSEEREAIPARSTEWRVTHARVLLCIIADGPQPRRSEYCHSVDKSMESKTRMATVKTRR